MVDVFLPRAERTHLNTRYPVRHMIDRLRTNPHVRMSSMTVRNIAFEGGTRPLCALKTDRTLKDDRTGTYFYSQSELQMNEAGANPYRSIALHS